MEATDSAFCPLLWTANGGSRDGHGNLIRQSSELVRGRCDRPRNCDTCPIFHHQIVHEDLLWVCCSCAQRTVEEKPPHQVIVPGYYSEGPCQHPECGRQKETDYLLQAIVIERTV